MKEKISNDKELLELIAEAESSKIKDLKDTNTRLLKQIDKLKDKKADMVEAVFQGARDGMRTLQFPDINKPTTKKSTKKDEQICVPLISDIQLAKRTPDYDTNVAEKRVKLYAEKIVKLAEIQSQLTHSWVSKDLNYTAASQGTSLAPSTRLDLSSSSQFKKC